MVNKKITAFCLAVASIIIILPVSTSAAAQNGWSLENNSWVYYDNGGYKTGWLKDGENWYYMYPDGSMATGWVLVNSDWYFLDQNGAMKYATTVNGYRLGGDGALIKKDEPGRIGYKIIDELVKLGYFYIDNSEGKNRVQMVKREGGVTTNYLLNQIVYTTSCDGTTDSSGNDMIIQRCKDDVESNAELLQLLRMVLPNNVDELKAVFDSSEKEFTTTIGGRAISRSTYGGQPLVRIGVLK